VKVAGWELEELVHQLTVKGIVVSEAAVATGHPAAMIVRKAEEIDADLILIGAGKWAGREPFLAGPIAEAVLQHATAPVLMIRPGEPKAMFRQLLCPVDHSPASARGLRTAVGLAEAFGGRLHVVSVAPEIGRLHAAVKNGMLSHAVTEHKRRWRDEFKQFLTDVEFGKVPWTRETRVGVPRDEIVASAQEHHADVIVMGATGRSGLAGIVVGSVTRRVLQHLPCSLLTVKAEETEGKLLDHIRHINSLMTQGRRLCAARSYPLALAKFREVMALDPYHVAALEGLAEVYEELEQVDKAQRYRRRAQLLSLQECERAEVSANGD
jgi:nucleotide-binding universal stress UspA family protein